MDLTSLALAATAAAGLSFSSCKRARVSEEALARTIATIPIVVASRHRITSCRFRKGARFMVIKPPASSRLPQRTMDIGRWTLNNGQGTRNNGPRTLAARRKMVFPHPCLDKGRAV